MCSVCTHYTSSEASLGTLATLDLSILSACYTCESQLALCSLKLITLQMYERQIGRKHPRYYATTRLGRNLKDRCTKTDPEREILNKMLEELKTKWTSLRTEISQKSVYACLIWTQIFCALTAKKYSCCRTFQ